VLCTTHDHFVHHEAIRLTTARNGATARRVSLFDNAADATVEGLVTRIRDEIRPKTRVLGITWVHSATGIRLPVREIAAALAKINSDRAEADRVLLVLDGVHGIGAVDETIAELGCDFFCAGTHKWMLAPRGTGIMWAKPDMWKRLRPAIPSFSAFDTYDAWSHGKLPTAPTTAAHVTPGGFLAYEHQWAMGAAFRMHAAIGRDRIGTRIAELNTQIKEGLAKMSKVKLHTPRDAKLSAGINCFEVEGMKPEDVVAKLLEKKVIASTSPYAVTYARLSAGLMNTPEQVDKALAATRAVIGA
jgi:selenocysteine lyase/cysteine desulfurase